MRRAISARRGLVKMDTLEEVDFRFFVTVRCCVTVRIRTLLRRIAPWLTLRFSRSDANATNDASSVFNAGFDVDGYWSSPGRRVSGAKDASKTFDVRFVQNQRLLELAKRHDEFLSSSV